MTIRQKCLSTFGESLKSHHVIQLHDPTVDAFDFGELQPKNDRKNTSLTLIKLLAMHTNHDWTPWPVYQRFSMVDSVYC